MTPSLLWQLLQDHAAAAATPRPPADWGLFHGAVAWNHCLGPSPCTVELHCHALSCLLKHPSPMMTKPCSTHMVAEPIWPPVGLASEGSHVTWLRLPNPLLQWPPRLSHPLLCSHSRGCGLTNASSQPAAYISASLEASPSRPVF